ncbi:hypothetical protein E6P09_06905 [Haloferax mediterranei ATCC 33500]|uniref:Uncharacterized protein n=1 Tax=Haloferax mediterranei (strain ATCC 33500 / DSM 1411 / JCM 8866 / NBRC 14739 / NCIMB 2177 / R-4) TaxID=523841 RepID=I3R2N8_HALMT|nr:hypothetical protein HFX_0775 [Haloferax mediterranei ATCC 33500]AHZ22122.1 hypothetical protein BM92_05365 [Haloferax mediterranei ATCC 33500]EMA02229.1 hypothetical protein C439_06600 [Haloferax mediterranei ATCC 33500]QCQ75002.1 hypothetical protein E6P09_06905 [Haloferax mediterranei ATCC 33500]
MATSTERALQSPEERLLSFPDCSRPAKRRISISLFSNPVDSVEYPSDTHNDERTLRDGVVATEFDGTCIQRDDDTGGNSDDGELANRTGRID